MNAAGTRENARFTDVSSSVNYLNVSPAIASSPPIIQAAGTDTNVQIDYLTKGNGTHNFKAASGSVTQFLIAYTASAVNYPYVLPSATGSPVQLAANGSDSNIDLQLTPRGSGGRVRFGTLTANADAAITGYIEVKDAGGTTRKLAVIA
jgi:hypothetical protein